MALKNDWSDSDWFGSQDQNDIADAVNLASSTVATHTGQIADKADKVRKITAGTGLSGGGDLTADRTLSADFGSTAGKVCEGNDARLSDTRAPKAHTHSASDITSGQFAAARMPTGYVQGSVNGTATNLSFDELSETQWANTTPVAGRTYLVFED
ncbi:hypothetical protein ABQE69_08970 [Mycolicibacillus trivialis]